MNQLQQALQKALDKGGDDPIKEMGRKALEKSKKIAVKRARIKKKFDPKNSYLARFRRIGKLGEGDFHPVSLLNWPPGKPAMINDNYCIVKWGLSDGKTDKVGVVFDYLQSVEGVEGVKSYYAIVPVENLNPCTCKGYHHKGHCSPE